MAVMPTQKRELRSASVSFSSDTATSIWALPSAAVGPAWTGTDWGSTGSAARGWEDPALGSTHASPCCSPSPRPGGSCCSCRDAEQSDSESSHPEGCRASPQPQSLGCGGTFFCHLQQGKSCQQRHHPAPTLVQVAASTGSLCPCLRLPGFFTAPQSREGVKAKHPDMSSALYGQFRNGEKGALEGYRSRNHVQWPDPAAW